jgi:hypothetical protein
MYEKSGFERVAEFAEWPEGHSNFILCKTLIAKSVCRHCRALGVDREMAFSSVNWNFGEKRGDQISLAGIGQCRDSWCAFPQRYLWRRTP